MRRERDELRAGLGHLREALEDGEPAAVSAGPLRSGAGLEDPHADLERPSEGWGRMCRCWARGRLEGALRAESQTGGPRSPSRRHLSFRSAQCLGKLLESVPRIF